MILNNIWRTYWELKQKTYTSRRSCPILSRFLFFLIFRQDSFSIPSIQVSCLKKLILPFWQDSCRPNLGWWGKKFFSRQDSCILAFLEFLSDSYFSWCSCLILFFLDSCLFLISCVSCLILVTLKKPFVGYYYSLFHIILL